MTKDKRYNNLGFSLVELIIVIAIMAILAGAIAPALIRYIKKARASRATEEARVIVTAVETGLASKAGEDAPFLCNKTFVRSDGTSTNCGLITNWMLSEAQSGTVYDETNPEYPNYLLAMEILDNLSSSSNNTYKFFNFTGNNNNPIGMNCSQFASAYHDCPGVIICYSDAGKVVFLEYYNYGCLVRYENGEYKHLEDETSFVPSSRIH